MGILFSPGQIGQLSVRNRLVMPPMVMNFPTENGRVTDQYLRFYEERARGGVGLLIVGAMYVDPSGRGFPHQLGIHGDELIPDLLRLTRAIHDHGGAAFAQLSFRSRERAPADFSRAELEGLVRDFTEAARRASRAGFDGVELHACYDYLLHQFLSPVTNRRGDDFGGDLSGRARLLLWVAKEVKGRTGSAFPLSCRISADEFVPGGIALPESQQIARRLRESGVDVIHVSAGVGKTTQHMIPPMEMPAGALLPLAAGIRQAAGPPVIGVGKVDSLDLAERAVADSQADFVSLGRGLLADPDLPRKYRENAVSTVRPCIGCNFCVERIRNFEPATCSVNPELGREGPLEPISQPQDVTVVGAGPAGVVAALILSRRGHRVQLWERRPAIGGKLPVAAIPPHKELLGTLVRYLDDAVRRSQIVTHLGAALPLGSPTTGPARIAVVATGALPGAPRIPGLAPDFAVSAEDLLQKGAGQARRFLVVGGALVGLETADFLMTRGGKVVIVEQLETIGQGVPTLRRDLIVDRLQAGGVTVWSGTRLVRIDGRRPVVCQNGVEKMLEAFDRVVLATGYVPDRSAVEWARDRFQRVIVVGDAREPHGILEAMADGYEAGRMV